MLRRQVRLFRTPDRLPDFSTTPSIGLLWAWAPQGGLTTTGGTGPVSGNPHKDHRRSQAGDDVTAHPLRRSGFNTRSRWVDVVKDMGMPGLHLHDLRHTGNMLAAESGAGLKDLMARMGHDNVRAAMIYQHAARGADKAITDAINKQLQARDVADEMPAG
ncbi:tyrosine-type recombinase/integrase [Nonomuraea sediminis]|nr:tyrosine-type recombinase/integrase [Nonomuraea sediminis]